MMRALTIAALAAAVLLTMAGGVSAGTQNGALVTLHAKNHTTKAATVCTTWKPTTVPCSNYTVQWPPGLPADVYLVVARGKVAPGIAGLSCGVQYPSTIGMFGWTLCADLQYPNAGWNGVWPASGGGNRITWSALDACQRTVIGTDGVHAIAGAFYVYAYGDGQLEITHNNNLAIPELAVADCAASVTYLDATPNWDQLPQVGFGCAYGCNPCGAPTAWQPHACGVHGDPPWWSPVPGGARSSLHSTWPDCGVPVEPITWGRIKARY